MAHVLLIDDEPSLLRTFECFLVDAGHRATGVATGDAALAVFDDHEFDVVITDVILPRTDGIALLREFRERAPGLPVVLIAGEPTLDIALAALRLRAFDFLPKPVDKEALLDVVRRAEARTGPEVAVTRSFELSLATLRNESIGALAGGVAHEINNPVNGILNYAQLIRDRLPAGQELLGEFADEIIAEASRVAVLLRQVLRFVHQDGETFGPVALTAALGSAEALVRTVFRHDQVDLCFTVADDLPLVHGCSGQITQILLVLLATARAGLNCRYPDYDPGKTAVVEATACDRDGSPWVRVTVRFAGPELPPEEITSVFLPHPPLTGYLDRCRPALVLSRELAAKHGGTLSLSTAGRDGTEFVLELPALPGS